MRCEQLSRHGATQGTRLPHIREVIGLSDEEVDVTPCSWPAVRCRWQWQEADLARDGCESGLNLPSPGSAQQPGTRVPAVLPGTLVSFLRLLCLISYSCAECRSCIPPALRQALYTYKASVRLGDIYNDASDTPQHTLPGRSDKAAFGPPRRVHNSATSRSLALSLRLLLLLVLLYVCLRERLHVRVDILLNVGWNHRRLGAQIIDGATQRIVLLDEEIAETVRVA